MPKFQKDVVKVLSHFGGFSNQTTLYPGQFICAMTAEKTVYAQAKIEFEFEGADEEVGLPIYDIGSLNSVIKLFTDLDSEGHTVTAEANQLVFRAGEYEQTFYLSDPELLEGQFPKNAKMNALCAQSMPLQFDLDEKDLATFEKGAKVAKANAVILRTRNGRVEMVAAEVDDNGNIEHGSSSFVYRTKIETEHEFNLGIPKASLLFLPGSYKVMVNQKFIIFEGEVVRYVATALGWSKFDLN
jgi:hypothetical protein